MKDVNYQKHLNDLEAIVKKLFEDDEQIQIEKARQMIELGKIIKQIPVKLRNFTFLGKYEEVISSNDVDYAIAASKIIDIEKYLGLGWKRIRKICENTKQHSKIDLTVVTKEFGDLKEDDNLNTYLIHYQLKSNEIKCDKNVIKTLVRSGLALKHITKKSIERLKNSNNQTITLKYMMFKIAPDEINIISNKDNITKNDIKKVDEICAFFRVLSNDENRLCEIPSEHYIALLKSFEKLSEKYKNSNISVHHINQTKNMLYTSN